MTQPHERAVTGAEDTVVSGVDATISSAGADDTLAASHDQEPAAPSRVRIATSVTAGAVDYPTLLEVDPAHYVIERELAHGGMGRVLVARDRRLGRAVAVKETLRPTTRVARRFEREARITARLQHPSIISIHEAGTWPSGEPFYAMRLVTGRSLDEALAAAGSYAERLALLPNVLAVADAMAYAHDQGVIHRDLKPKNVVVGGFGETVVIDWGLAKELGSAALGGSLDPDGGDPRGTGSDTGTTAGGETVDGEVLGTPAYMPPEQANGQPVDARADVYAIGALLYHLLTGRAPYAADSNAELLAAVHSGPPTPLAQVAPEIATELRAITERAMARDPEARYPTAHELALDLRRFQTGQLVGAHRYSLGQLVRRKLRQHRTAVTTIGAALVVAIVIGVVALRRVVAAERVAQRERGQALASRHDAEELMQFMLGDLHGKLAGLGKLKLLDGVATRAVAYYDRRGATTDDELVSAARARLAIADVFAARGDLATALTQADAAAARTATLLVRAPANPRYRELAADVQLFIASARVEQGDTAAGRAIYEALLAQARAELARDPAQVEARRLVVKAGSQVATLQRLAGDLATARAGYEEVLKVALELAAEEPSDAADEAVANAHSDLGGVLQEAKRDLPTALAEYRAGLAISEKLVAREPDRPVRLAQLALSHRDVAIALQAQDDLAGALAELDLAATTIARAVAVDPSNTRARDVRAEIDERIGVVRLANHDVPGATAAFTAAAATWDELSRQDPSNLGWLRARSLLDNKLGDVHMASERPADALPRYQSALAVREQLIARDPKNIRWRRDLFYSHYKIALTYRALVDHPRALAELRAGLAIALANRAAQPDNDRFNRDVAETYGEIANELIDLRDRSGSLAALEAALAVAQPLADRTDALPYWTKMTAILKDAIAHPPPLPAGPSP